MTMRLTLGAVALTGLLTFGMLALAAIPARAGCGGRGGSRGGVYGGHSFGRASYGGYSSGRAGCSSGCGMAMTGASMPMLANGYAPAGSSGNTGNGQATAASYTCPMHPGVVSSTPGGCPYCGMALNRR